MKKYIFFLMLNVLFFSCKNNENALIGKWVGERNWIEFTSDSTYQIGVKSLNLVSNLKYKLTKEKKQLELYTEDPNTQLYYTFEIKKDTLFLKDMMMENDAAKVYIKNNEQ